MAIPRTFVDRPTRRVSVSLLVAVAVHAVVLGAGWYFVKDYVRTDYFKPRGPLTQKQFEQTVAQLPMYTGVAQTPSIIDREQVIESSPAWRELRVVQARHASLPLVSHWTFDRTMMARIDSTGAVPRQ